jgi:hypothetical protein
MPYPATACFWVEPNGKAERTLRRYSLIDGEGTCPREPGEYSCHNASVPIGVAGMVWSAGDEYSDKYVSALDVSLYAGDPRWPTHCGCGYEFLDDDPWQVNQEPIYESADGRTAWTSPAHERQPTPGAMFDTFWRTGLRKEDGLAISVVCPNGAVWCIDAKASSGGYWSRTGTAPNITVTPSIVAGDYHGFLQAGVLTAG